jgi:hypothetical protein
MRVRLVVPMSPAMDSAEVRANTLTNIVFEWD